MRGKERENACSYHLKDKQRSVKVTFPWEKVTRITSPCRTHEAVIISDSRTFVRMNIHACRNLTVIPTTNNKLCEWSHAMTLNHSIVSDQAPCSISSRMDPKDVAVKFREMSDGSVKLFKKFSKCYRRTWRTISYDLSHGSLYRKVFKLQKRNLGH